MHRVVLFLCFCGSVRAGAEINDTQFSELPPLYGLDEWAQCQRPGDVWCMVDAELVADGPSDSLALLQEYSQETLKHYNRSQVHRGLCVSRCGAQTEGGAQSEGAAPWDAAARACLQQELAKYNLKANVLSVSWCSSGRVEATGGARALAILCVVLVALVFLATTLHILGERCAKVDGCRKSVNAIMCVVLVALVFLTTTLHMIGERCAKVDGNKYLLAFSMKKNWAILTYDRSRPRSDDRMKDLTCMEGIRFIGMQCVIFSHVLLIYIYSYTDNPQFIERMYDHFGWQGVLNSPLWLQAFFAMSGFLTTYSTIITVHKDPITLFKCFAAILNRFVRLTPAAGVALWFTISWYPLLGSGPQWAWLVTRESHDCAERWWYHILYVHNHLPMGKFCMGHTWYLAADMQLHVVGLLLLLVLVRWRVLVAPVLAMLVVASGLASGLVTYFYDLTPIVTGQAPEVLRTMFEGSKILSLVYLPSWMNLAGYAGGMATAFLLNHIQDCGVKLNQNKWFNLAFHLSLSLGSAVVLSGTVFLRAPRAGWAAALYSSLDRPLVAICFNVFLLGCFVKCKSAVRALFEWRGFHLLGRLSYCVFIIHFIVLRLALGGNTQLNHASLYSLITLLISVSVLSYVAAIPYCLLVELPAIELWRALTKGDRTERRSEVQQPPPTVKPLDLVASITRRQEV